jgi:hypothetical protein
MLRYVKDKSGTIQTRQEQHKRNLCLRLPDNSAVLEDSTDFSSTSTVNKKTGYAQHLNKEAAEIKLTPHKLPRGWNIK